MHINFLKTFFNSRQKREPLKLLRNSGQEPKFVSESIVVLCQKQFQEWRSLQPEGKGRSCRIRKTKILRKDFGQVVIKVLIGRIAVDLRCK